MKIPYLIMVCTVLLVSGAISVGSTDIIGKAGEKASITVAQEGIERQIDDKTTHGQVRLHRTVNNDAANQAAENSQASMEFVDKGRSVQSRRLHVSRVQLTIFSLGLLTMRPLGHG